jgi:hypothetical protein
MARISVRGALLYTGDVPWRAWGMNWGAGDREPVLAYFDDPTPARLAVLTRQMRTVRSIGANSMRIYLELGQVMQAPTVPRARTLTALTRLLDVAEREQVYLDITGNLVWRPSRVPNWYEHLTEHSRWLVQATFWDAVAHTAARSPAVLCYELTSEPIIGERQGHYLGRMGDWTFVQNVANAHGRDPCRLARAWSKLLAGTVRSQDNRPVTIGLLPVLDGAFAPANVADLLDMLVVHVYPAQGQASQSVALVRAFASYGKPVLLGETFPLLCGTQDERQFLLGANRYVAGVHEFFDGRDPRHMKVRTVADALYQAGLSQFIDLRRTLLAPQRGKAPISGRRRCAVSAGMRPALDATLDAFVVVPSGNRSARSGR